MTDHTQNINFNPNRAEEIKTGKTAPAPKKTKKDFKKILSKKRQEDQPQQKNKELSQKPKTEDVDKAFEDVELKLQAYDQKPKTKEVSLFDIASDSVTENESEMALENLPAVSTEETGLDLPHADMPDDIHKESLSALFKGYGTKEKLAFMQQEVKNTSTHLPDNQFDTSDRTEKKPHIPFDDFQKQTTPSTESSPKIHTFPREQIDLTSVNPHAALPPTPPLEAIQTQNVQYTPVRTQELQEIVDQIVSKLYTISSKGKTDTLIKLRHPPAFSGSSVVITSFNSAKGEFNITFENLTQVAKKMMDMQENQNSLKFALEQKGYTVHIITATTLSETTQLTEGQSLGKEQSDDESGSFEEKQQQEKEKEETT